jgi:peptidoglycan/LPS O-acetylase OafA/YrhL
MFISLAAPFFLKKIGEVKPHHWLLSIMALVLLIIPIVGTVYPEPSYPCNYFAYIYGAYMLAGVIVVLMRSRSKVEIESIRKVLDETTVTPTAAMDSSMPPTGLPAVN